MVLFTGDDGVTRKYACITCIKGHRSTKCAHTNRRLVEIKRKGRPQSQCGACRALRANKKMHVKCSCGNKAEHSITAPLSPLSPSPLPAPGESPPSLAGGPSDTHVTTPAHPPANPNRSEGAHASSRPTHISNPLTSEEPGNLLRHSISAPSLTILPPIRHTTPSNQDYHQFRPRRSAIPIHDPADDIDSDTPIYKPEEANAPDRHAVLGELCTTSRDDLMEKLYSPFKHS